jgi:hypothetical protein
MGASGHPGDVEGSASMGDFVDDVVCVLRHAEVVGKPVCIGFVSVPPRIDLMLRDYVILVTIGVALSAGRLDAVTPTSSRESPPLLFPQVLVISKTYNQ